MFLSVRMRVDFIEAVMGAVQQETSRQPETQCWSSRRVVGKQLAIAWTEPQERQPCRWYQTTHQPAASQKRPEGPVGREQAIQAAFAGRHSRPGGCGHRRANDQVG